MPRILFRHIVADLLRIMTLTASVLVTVIAFGAAIRPIMQNLLGAEDLLQYVAFASVPMLQFALPFSAAFAGTIVYARLAADNEVLAMTAAGLSYRRILAPAAGLGLVLLVAMALLVDVAVPRFWTSMQRVITRDVTRLFVSAIERGEALEVPGTGTQLYADEVKVLPGPEIDGMPTQRLALAGVAAIEVGPDGVPVTEFTADFATVDVYRTDESAYMKLLFKNATAFRDGEDALVYVPLAEPEAIDLGRGIRLTPKDLNLAGLLELWGNVDGYHRVETARARLEGRLGIVDRWRCVERALADGGVLRLRDLGGRRVYEVRNAVLAGKSLKPRTGDAIELVELERGVATRRATVDTAEFILEERERDGGARFELLARANLVADLRGLGGGGRWPSRLVGLAPENCPEKPRGELPAEALLAETDAIAPAATERSPRVNSEVAAARAGDDLRKAIRATRAEIVARIVQRANQALAAPLMLLLGATLAIRLRGANPLAIYLLAFLPSIACVLLISGGEQMLKEETSVLGVLVATSGNIGIAAAIATAYRQVARN